MIGKEKIKYVRSLHQKKFRQKYNKFIAEGTKIVGECLTCCPNQIDAVYGLSSYLQTLDIQDSTLKKKLIEVDENQLKKISALENPNQILAVVNLIEESTTEVEGDAIYLDGVQIPNNVGAILRIAEWYGIDNIIVGPNTADLFSPKVIQASMGSFLRLKIRTWSGSEVQSLCPGHAIVVADWGGQSLSHFQFDKPTVMVMGSEGQGPSDEMLHAADHVVSIPKIGGGAYPESLNVAVAAGILCHHWKG